MKLTKQRIFHNILHKKINKAIRYIGENHPSTTKKKNKVKERAVTKVAHLESLGGQQNYLGFLA
jgi:hypothetical protein